MSKRDGTCERQAASQSHDDGGGDQALFTSETLRQSASLPRSPSTATLTYCSTATSAHTPPPPPLSPSPTLPPPHPALGTDGAARPRLGRPLICLWLCCGTAGVLIRTAETTMTAWPTMQDQGGRRGTPEDGARPGKTQTRHSKSNTSPSTTFIGRSGLNHKINQTEPGSKLLRRKKHI